MTGPRDALALYEGCEGALVSPLGGGLVNTTFAVEAPAGRLVLQRVSAIFDPAIHQNIAAVTERLARASLITPRLCPTRTGEPCGRLDDGSVWRLMTRVEGVPFDRLASPDQGRAAARLVGRFHRIVADLDHRFVGMRTGVHDTVRHLEKLRRAIGRHPSHRLATGVQRLAGAAFEAAVAHRRAWREVAAAPAVIGHGDLKLNNILFAGAEPPARDQPVCLIDLDTVGPLPLAHELGDMWRSWCNPAGEDATAACFDVEAMAASWAGYTEGLGRVPDPKERATLLAGVEQISLELCVRFAADALEESYFGFDRARYPAAGEHNLVRAEGQFALYQAVLACRPQRAAVLGLQDLG